MESDREIVKSRILKSGFASVDAFDVYVKEVAVNTLKSHRASYCYGDDSPFTIEGGLPAFPDLMDYSFEASETDENECCRCDKLKEHHHTKKRDGTISKYEWCYDFLLD